MSLTNVLKKLRARKRDLAAEAERMFSAGTIGYPKTRNERERREIDERIARLVDQLDAEDAHGFVAASEARIAAAESASTAVAPVPIVRKTPADIRQAGAVRRDAMNANPQPRAARAGTKYCAWTGGRAVTEETYARRSRTSE